MLAIESLYKILEHQSKRVREAYPSDELAYLLIEIIRSLDYAMFMLKHDFLVTTIFYGEVLPAGLG